MAVAPGLVQVSRGGGSCADQEQNLAKMIVSVKIDYKMVCIKRKVN